MTNVFSSLPSLSIKFSFTVQRLFESEGTVHQLDGQVQSPQELPDLGHMVADWLQSETATPDIETKTVHSFLALHAEGCGLRCDGDCAHPTTISPIVGGFVLTNVALIFLGWCRIERCKIQTIDNNIIIKPHNCSTEYELSLHTGGACS